MLIATQKMEKLHIDEALGRKTPIFDRQDEELRLTVFFAESH